MAIKINIHKKYNNLNSKEKNVRFLFSIAVVINF
jgi:uncharacterized protein affecting Mg2+/Co2+ transport